MDAKVPWHGSGKHYRQPAHVRSVTHLLAPWEHDAILAQRVRKRQNLYAMDARGPHQTDPANDALGYIAPDRGATPFELDCP
jgi:hypothetical protein